VRNSEEATKAGAGMLLVPGYEIMASSDMNDDLSRAEFMLPPPQDDRPVFIVPSAAKGEEGCFTVVVEGSAPVDMVEVEDVERDLWAFQVDQDLQWSDKMPHRKNCGGGRLKKCAPPLTWYRNPQFRVRLKSRAQVARAKSEAEAAQAVPSALVAQFPFADGAAEDGAEGSDVGGEGSSAAAASLVEEVTAEVVPVVEAAPKTTMRVEILGASSFSDAQGMADSDLFCACRSRRAGGAESEEIFRTEAVSDSPTPEWNNSYEFTEPMDDGFEFIIHLFRDGEEEGAVTMPYSEFQNGFDGEIGIRRYDGVFDGVMRLRFTSANMLDGAEAETLGGLYAGEDKPTAEAERSSKFNDLLPDSRPTSPEAKPARPALLQVRLLPVDAHQKVPCAVHIVKNDRGHLEEKCIYENPYHHSVIGASGEPKKDYLVASEVGCVCKLMHGETEEDEGEPVYVIASLEKTDMHGRFHIQLLATEDVTVERIH